MIQIVNLSNDFNQNISQDLSIIGLYGKVKLYLRYNQRFFHWIISIEIYDNDNNVVFTKNGSKLINGSPLLYSFPFLEIDIICITSNNLPPMDIDDFITGTASSNNNGIFILTKTELNELYA